MGGLENAGFINPAYRREKPQRPARQTEQKPSARNISYEELESAVNHQTEHHLHGATLYQHCAV